MAAFDSSAVDFTREDMPTVGAFDIFNVLRNSFSDRVTLAGNVDWQFNDPRYGFPSHEQVMTLVPLLPAEPLPYIPGERECDEFTRIDRGWLAFNGLGNTTIGEVRFDVFGPDGYIGWHECLIAGDSSGARYFIEPQTNILHSWDDPVTWIFPDAVSARITDLVF